jgi:hypothetical protein
MQKVHLKNSKLVPATVGLRTVFCSWVLLVKYGKITVLQNTQFFNQLNIIYTDKIQS